MIWLWLCLLMKPSGYHSAFPKSWNAAAYRYVYIPTRQLFKSRNLIWMLLALLWSNFAVWHRSLREAISWDTINESFWYGYSLIATEQWVRKWKRMGFLRPQHRPLVIRDTSRVRVLFERLLTSCLSLEGVSTLRKYLQVIFWEYHFFQLSKSRGIHFGL